MKSHQHALALALIGATAAAQALEIDAGDGIAASLNGVIGVGTMVRTEAADPDVYALPPSTRVPRAAPGRVVGQTGGSDLDYEKHHAVSTVLKALVDVDVHGRSLGVFARGSAWHDYSLGHASAAYGNYANGYESGAALSDRGFSREARFDGVDLLDVYAWGRFDFDNGARIEARLGRQVLNWGLSPLTTGSINAALNPQNFAAQVRPGALPQEARLPIAMLDLRLRIDERWSAEGFVAFESRRNVLPGCGTFFDVASVVAHGCMLSGAVPSPIAGTPMSTLSSLTEHSILRSGYYLHRNEDVEARNGGQGGLALRFRSDSLATEFSIMAARMHSSSPMFRLTIENVNGTTLPPGLAGGLARLSHPQGLTYATRYPENVRIFGATFDTTLDAATRVYGEVAYRPDQPIAMNANDLLNGSLLRSPTAVLQAHSRLLDVPAGGSFDAYDRFAVTTASLGASKVLPAVLGAARLALSGEVGISHVAGLPDPLVMRYGRPLAYGTAPYLVDGVQTPCSESAPGLNGVSGKTCTTDGFITTNAWGVRLRAAATYPAALLGAALTPSLLIAQDISGYAHDGSYSEGRRTVRAGLRFDWGKAFFADIQYTRFSGGRYNLLTDRDNLTLVAGASF